MTFLSLFILSTFTSFLWSTNSSQAKIMNKTHGHRGNILIVPDYEFDPLSLSATNSISMDSPLQESQINRYDSFFEEDWITPKNGQQNNQENGFLRVPDHNLNHLLSSPKSWTSMNSPRTESQVNRYYSIFREDWKTSPKKTNNEILICCLNNEKVKQYLKGFMPLTYLILYHLLKMDMTIHEKKLFLKLFYLEKIFNINIDFEPLIYIHFRRHMYTTFQLPKFIESITFRLMFRKLIDKFINIFDINRVKFHCGHNSPNYIDINGDEIWVKKQINYQFGRISKKYENGFEKKLYSLDEIFFVLKNKNELELYKIENHKMGQKKIFVIQLKEFYVICFNDSNISSLPFYLDNIKLNFSTNENKNYKHKCTIV